MWTSRAEGLTLSPYSTAREHYECMNRLSETFIKILEDGASYNDSPSPRLLIKVLCWMLGLEHDARIAYPAQFSILDRQLQDDPTS